MTKPEQPQGLSLSLLEMVATWGPMTFADAVHMLYFTEGFRRPQTNMIQEAWVKCIRKRWLIPLGCAYQTYRGVDGFVVWGLTNSSRYVHGSQYSGPLDQLPWDGLDPAMPKVKERLWPPIQIPPALVGLVDEG